MVIEEAPLHPMLHHHLEEALPEGVTFVLDTTLANAHMDLDVNSITDVVSVENTGTGHTSAVEHLTDLMGEMISEIERINKINTKIRRGTTGVQERHKSN